MRLRLALVLVMAGFVAASLLYKQVIAPGGSHRLAWQDLTRRLGPIQYPRGSARLFRSPEKLRDYLSAIMPGDEPAAPRIDFRRREALLLLAGPRSSTGYSVRVLSVTEHGDRVVVKVRERTPSLGQRVQARVTYPYRLITFARSGKRVYVEWQGRP